MTKGQRNYKYAMLEDLEPMLNTLRNMGLTERDIYTQVGMGTTVFIDARAEGRTALKTYYAIKGLLCEKKEKGGEQAPVVGSDTLVLSQAEALVGISALTYARGRRLFTEADTVTATGMIRKFARRLSSKE